jgi:uncharacterized cofD-like protein
MEQTSMYDSISRTRTIVTIGGGTGTHTLLTGLKKYPAHAVEPVAVVTMADSGGSTGRLRDEFGYLPVGDVRMALVALAEGDGDTMLRRLFMHRFDRGEGLRGHNVGNLLLVAMTDLLGSEEAAILEVSKILRIRGKVLPVTKDHVDLLAQYEDGSVVRGETHIDEPEDSHDSSLKISKLWLDPAPAVSERVVHEIERADLVVLGPGDLYTSLLANIVVPGVAEALQHTDAPIVYIMNLMTKLGQTNGFGAKAHLDEVVRYVGRAPDAVVVNSAALPGEILAAYEKEGEEPVYDDLGEAPHGARVIRADLLGDEVVVQPDGDILKRSLIRHDPDKLAGALMVSGSSPLFI